MVSIYELKLWNVALKPIVYSLTASNLKEILDTIFLFSSPFIIKRSVQGRLHLSPFLI